MKLLGLACCPVLFAVEVYRRGYAAAVLYGCKQWSKATWRTEPEFMA